MVSDFYGFFRQVHVVIRGRLFGGWHCELDEVKFEVDE